MQSFSLLILRTTAMAIMATIGAIFCVAIWLVFGMNVTQSKAVTPDAESHFQLAPPGTRFEFEVIESYNAKYEGDQPGHKGRDGGLVQYRPHVALKDPVYRNEKKVGTISSIIWDRVSAGLTIEFDPEPNARVSVGDEVWIDLNPAGDPDGDSAVPAR